ncbi:unnamed protein product [Meganyctiphanes norvegica]|uniref:WAP domain-containing protein n=1 Tax=Meganyctiphanes norvegica TaxID=48144 RepID=A0AAV2SEY7_MEGNR
MKAFISTILLVASASQGTIAAPSDSTDTNTRGFFGANRPVGGYNAGVNTGFGGVNTVGGGVNPGFGGVNPGFGGVNQGFGGVNPGFGGVNPGFGGVNPGVGGGVVPASGSVCQFWCNRGGKYVCCENSQQAHPGRCPVPRPQCPPVRSGFQGPQSCNLDIDCPFQNKCCYDTCLNDRVCKPAQYYLDVTWT